jgi:transposase
MYSGKIVFAQVMELLPLRRFHGCVRRYRGDFKVKTFTCKDHFKVMAFAQLSHRESLRDIEICLRAMQPKLYHLGISSSVSRNNLSNANEVRDWRIYADFAQVLISHARQLYADEDFGKDLADLTLYALDASTIDLCLSLFPWAHFRRTKAAIKLHTLIDLRGNIPTFVHVSDGKVHDVNVLDILLLEPGAFYVMDRGYLDYERLYRMNQARAFFLTRAKRNARFRRTGSRPVDKASGLRCDQTVVLETATSATNCPEPLRRIAFVAPDTQKKLVFITNNFDLPALTITQIYKARCQVELFFKWIKQHLRIKAFYGTSENAVKTQIWIAISTYVLVAILKRQSQLSRDLDTILQVLSVSLFEKVPIPQLLADWEPNGAESKISNQLSLFE